MDSDSSLELVNGEIIFHDNSLEMDKRILDRQQVAAIKLLIQKCTEKDFYQI